MPFDVVTSLGVYESVFFDGSLTIDRNVSNNTVLAFTATFSAMDFIETETTVVPASESKLPEKTAPAEDVGKKQLQDDSPASAENKSSTLFDITSGILG